MSGAAPAGDPFSDALGRAVPRMSGSKVPLRCARNARTIWRASAGGNQNVLYALFNHEC